MTANVGVLGLGSWGTALANHLASNALDVIGWTRNLPSIHVPSYRITDKIDDLNTAEVLVLALPARALPSALEKYDFSRNRVIMSAAKGMVPKTDSTPLAFLADQFQIPLEKLAVLSGPSFASDVMNHRPASVVIASKNKDVAQELSLLFASPSFRVYTSEDTLGVELGGITKNVLAIAAGISDALGLGPSARAGLITRGLSEMQRLGEALGVDSRTITGLSGLGDLIMTATDDQSRNRQMGLRLGRGEKLEDALKGIGSEVEGVWTAPLLLQLATTHGVEMPITSQVARLLQGSIDPRQLAGELLSRPLKSEY